MVCVCPVIGRWPAQGIFLLLIHWLLHPKPKTVNKLILENHFGTFERNSSMFTVNICCNAKVLTPSSLFIIFIPTLTKGCGLHSRFKTNWLWWCLNYVSSSCKTLPWHGDVISSGPAETPLPYFLLPCTLNRSALRNVPRRLCSRARIIWP